jgi:hypothetical protein
MYRSGMIFTEKICWKIGSFIEVATNPSESSPWGPLKGAQRQDVDEVMPCRAMLPCRFCSSHSNTRIPSDGNYW